MLGVGVMWERWLLNLVIIFQLNELHLNASFGNRLHERQAPIKEAGRVSDRVRVELSASCRDDHIGVSLQYFGLVNVLHAHPLCLGACFFFLNCWGGQVWGSPKISDVDPLIWSTLSRGPRHGHPYGPPPLFPSSECMTWCFLSHYICSLSRLANTPAFAHKQIIGWMTCEDSMCVFRVRDRYGVVDGCGFRV